MKKIISVFLAAAMAFALLTVSAFADTGKNLSSLKPTATDRYTGNEGDSFIDVLGTRNGKKGTDGKTYKNGLEVWLARWNGKAEKSWVKASYNIKGEYSSLTGKIITIDNSYNKSDFDITVEINGDGKLLKKYNIVPSNKAKTVDIDVTGVKSLEIYAYDNREVCGGTSLGLVNFKLSKEDIRTNVSAATMNKGMELALTTDAAKSETLTWKSSSKSVASVSKDGVVTAKKAGKATITVTSSSGKSAEIKITVK